MKYELNFTTMKKIEMTLLNSEDLLEIQGGRGVSVPISTTAGGTVETICMASGDTIKCGALGKVKCCIMIEVGCTPHFRSSCAGMNVTITGCSSVTFN